MKNKLNWKTITTDNNRMLYLTIMRDIRAYCSKGFMEVSVVFFAFVELPAGLINREVYQMNLSIFERHLIVDWGTYDSVHKFYRRFIALVCQLNHEDLDCKAFNDAFEEFIQYLTYNKKL